MAPFFITSGPKFIEPNFPFVEKIILDDKPTRLIVQRRRRFSSKCALIHEFQGFVQNDSIGFKIKND